MKKLRPLCAAVLACGIFLGLAQSTPLLQVDSSNGSQVRLSWTNTPGTIVLEETDRLTPASVWRPTPQYPVLRNGQYSVTVHLTGDTRFFRLRHLQADGLPPDPSSNAPSISQGVATLLGEATEFLYTGPNPIQTGVAAGVIAPRSAAVVRGRVKQRDNTPLSGVAISILGRPEFGRTFSRADGMFDLAVNGGGLLTLNYEKTGLFPVQRQLNVPWQDYVIAPDVLMIPMDPVVTAIALGANSPLQVHRGSLQTDADGARQATLLFSAGTTAGLVLANGTTQTVGSLNVRATEFTVGPNGPAAMPGVLPPASGYTYCVELSADEAVAQGASEVRFDRPVFTYVENFIDFPTGMAVPVGFYDRTKAAWFPSTNGRVVKILGITGGLAEVDTDGDGNADAGEGLTEGERQQLALLYTAGQTLWRVPVSHFTPWDCNWPYGPPADATAPSQPPPRTEEAVDEGKCEENGSIIEAQNQILGETIGIVGTPFTLNYRSDRVPGRTDANTLEIQLSGSSVPASLKRIELGIQVGGRSFLQNFPAEPNQKTTFTWDGQDAYGRTLQGSQPLSGSIGYVYDGLYQQPSPFRLAFGLFGGAPITGNPARQEITISQSLASALGHWDVRGQGLGAWTLNIHHAYDPVNRMIYLGYGNRQKAVHNSRSITTVAGTGTPGFNGDGGLATQTHLFEPRGIAVGPDGSLYIADAGNSRIRRIGLDGLVTTVAGTGTPGFSGDGGPATQAQLNSPIGIALGPDGSLYIANGDVQGEDNGNSRVRRVGPDGIITTVAGTGTLGFSGDGGPATQAQLDSPFGVAVGPDNSLYIADAGNRRIRRVGPDGIITTVAGIGIQGSGGDGGPAIQAQLNRPIGVALGPDGSLFISDFLNQSIRRVGPDGIITTVAGTGTQGFGGDGGPAAQAQLNSVIGVALGPDNSLYIADSGNNRIRRVGPDGIITSVAGTGTLGFGGDGGPATLAQLFPAGVALGLDGNLYVSDFLSQRIRRVAQPLPGFGATDLAIPSEDGNLLYRFDASGRHLQTLNALTGVVIFEFGYDAAGRLAQVTEKTGGTDNITTIQRDGNGNPSAIVSPFGQRTALALDSNGFLSQIINPAAETNQITYTPDGLLASFTDANGQTATFQYDNLGRLLFAADSCCGKQTYTLTNTSSIHLVTRATSLGRVTTYSVQNLPTENQRLVNTFPDGTQSVLEIRQDGTQISSAPDGTVSTNLLGADPRFGMQVPLLASSTLAFPSGLQVEVTKTRSAMLANPADPLSLQTLTNTITVASRTTTNIYTAATRTSVSRTPAGRTQTVVLDTFGRLARSQFAGLDPVSVEYDNHGRLASLSMGSVTDTRSLSLTYNAQGYVDLLTNSNGRSVHFVYDGAGRVTRQTLPDGRILALGYDRNGNLTSLVPPGRPAHTLEYSERNQLTLYNPPNVPGTGPTSFSYDQDKALTNINRAGVQSVAIRYDEAGRPIARILTSDGGTPSTDTFTYDAAGRIANIVTASGVNCGYTYDGILTTGQTWSGPIAGSVTHTYNQSMQRDSQSVNGTNTIQFRYDQDGLLMEAGELVITRHSEHGLASGSRLGVVNSTLNYNGIGELTNYNVSASGNPVYGSRLDRDGPSRITQKIEIIEGATDTITYTYDAVSQLTSVSKNGNTVESYAYDANGNRTNATVGNITVHATYDDQDRLIQHGNTTYTHNAAGDLAGKTKGAQVTTYHYDALGNLLQVVLPEETTISYLVDGENRRVGKKVNGILVKGFLYSDSLRPIAELDGTSALVSRFVYAGRNVPAVMIKDGAAHRIITDHLGSVRLVVNSATGAVVQRIDYDGFGNVVLDTNPGFQPFGYAGGLYDPDTRLSRFGTRDYNAEAGRWTAKDPIRFAGGDVNLYRYVGNNPINAIDSLGMVPVVEDWLSAAMEVLARIEGQIIRDDQRLKELTESRLPVGLSDEFKEVSARQAANLSQAEEWRRVIRPILNCRSIASKGLKAFGPILGLYDTIKLGISGIITGEEPTLKDMVEAYVGYPIDLTHGTPGNGGYL